MKISSEGPAADSDGPKVSRVSVAGRFDAHETAGFRAAVEPLLAGYRPQLRLDLGSVLFIDSSALAELLRTQKRAREADGELVLTGLSDPVRVILELTALLPVFSVDLDPSSKLEA